MDINVQKIAYNEFSVTTVHSFAAITWFEMCLSEFGTLIQMLSGYFDSSGSFKRSDLQNTERSLI